MPHAAFVKRVSGQVLRSKEKRIICNVFNYIENKNSEAQVGLLIKLIELQAFRELQFSKFVLKKLGTHWYRRKKVRERKTNSVNIRKVEYSDIVRRCIQRKVHCFCFRNLRPMLSSLLTAVNNDPRSSKNSA
jgi:hypothetical protein